MLLSGKTPVTVLLVRVSDPRFPGRLLVWLESDLPWPFPEAELGTPSGLVYTVSGPVPWFWGGRNVSLIYVSCWRTWGDAPVNHSYLEIWEAADT